MAETGVRSPNIPKASTVDYLVGNSSGSTRLTSVDNLARQMLAQGPLRSALPTSGSNTMYFATYAAMVGTPIVLPPEQIGPLSAWVYADPDPAKCGVYRYLAGPPASWERVLDLPLQWGIAVHGAGSTGDAIIALTPLPASRSALIAIPIEHPNAAAEPTVSINGGDPLTIVSNTGLAIAPGGLVPPMVMWGYADSDDGFFRLLNDQVASAIVAAAEAAALAAVAAKDTAAEAMMLAERFANAPEDEEVIPGSGLYSSRHWMKKAEMLGTGTALGNAAFKNVGTAADTVAAGDDPRFGYGMPVGTPHWWAFPTPPPGSLVWNGQAVTPVYPELRAILLAAGSPWGMAGGDPKLLDLVTNGEFPRAGGPGGLPVGLIQPDQIREHFHHGGVGTTGTHAGRYGKTTGLPVSIFADTDNQANSDAQTTAFNTSSVGGSETRPRSIVWLPCIKAAGAVNSAGMADLAALLTAIADRPTAEAGSDNTKLMTPQNTRWAISSRLKWELIERVELNLAGSYIRTNLGEYEELLLDGFLLTSIAARVDLHLSADNGTTWIMTADHVGQASGMNGAAAAGANISNATGMHFTWTGLSSGMDFIFTHKLCAFNKARRTRGLGDISGIDAAPVGFTYTLGTWSPASGAGLSAHNAIRLLPNGGAISGKFSLFGRKG